MSKDIFGSSEFEDTVILKQLISLDHQLVLSCHGSWMEALGPCTVTLAAAMQASKTKEDAKKALIKYLNTNEKLDGGIKDVFIKYSDSILDGLRIIAESYLSRGGRALPSWGEGGASSTPPVPDQVLVGETGSKYVATKFLARGSAGLVYAAERDGKEGFVLKRVYPTQADSAMNEYKIATRLRGARGCLSYEDLIITGEKEIWLVLPLVERSDRYGVDLREYIVNGFFQDPANSAVARAIVIQLLCGLEDVSSRGIIMRDVKPDNVLIKSATKDGKYEAFWTDFGLAVDLGPELDGSGLRRITPQSTTPEKVRDDFVAWWYDACKLVPRPKWHARRPPERGFADPKSNGGSHGFDSYMTAIIFVCMAVGVDIPHIDQAETKSRFEKVLGFDLPSDYLKTFELGQSLKASPKSYQIHFERVFGAKFGQVLFAVCEEMLQKDPSKRPAPHSVVERLQILQ